MNIENYYDVFISFKNSDKDGNITKDRVIAKKLYEYLISKNLKVFFSEAILEELGTDSWHDEIEKALRSSKVFIALGTQEEYMKSKWVQKERTTFLALKYSDKSKALYSYIAPPMTIKNLPDDINRFECFEDTKPNEFKKLYSFISNHLARYFHRIKDN
ncbi:MAG: toll/interleukin-1 receptor domain-containing protein, partial [Sulfurovaceae bacterium]|nr:toll/interleukin-1 receptor domain-containing protein [Sulfurovaceae bacterium]